MTNPINQPGSSTQPPFAAEIDEKVMRLFTQYRFFLLTALGLVYYLSSTQSILGQRNAILFEVAHLGYGVAALGFIYLQKINWLSLTTRQYLQNYLDIVFICIMMYACGGVQSGFGVLLIITIALLSQLSSERYALYFAALACVLVLLEELLAQLLIGNAAANFERTAFLCTILMIVAWVLSGPLKIKVERQVVDATPDRAVLDVKDIANLNEEIIRELDSGVLVLDSNFQVQLINATARELLACEFATLPIHVGRLCSTLHANLTSMQRGSANLDPFTVEATGLALLPRYISLSSGGMLIRLDDHAQIREQYQQLKLASLGRLSASIAHEIRNPLGAISHAVQLLEESPSLTEEDLKLLTIAGNHTHRIDRIVEDVLQLSNRKLIRNELLNFSQILTDFAERFISEHHLARSSLVISAQPHIHATFDPDHLDQVLWNLCTNARLHNQHKDVTINISCWQTQQGGVVIDIVDNGSGISDLKRDQLFEPFYSTHHSGSGLGLYIIRELCELNKANIECVQRSNGAHFRITVDSAQQMAA